MLNRINKNKYLFIIFACIILCVVFSMNYFTYYSADDFSYMYSFANNEKIDSIEDIFPSLYAHAFSMNGRLVAHFFAQLFLMFPPILFDFFNSLIYILLIYLIYKISNQTREIDLFLFLIIAFSVWYVVPAYGSVFLWLDGSCNYSWGITAVLAYCYPFIKMINVEYNHKILSKRISKVMFIIAGLFVGGWLESASFAAILIAVITIFITKFINKKPLHLWPILSTITLSIGYILMMICPGQSKNKVGFIGFSEILKNFFRALNLYMDFATIPLAILIVLLVSSIYLKYNKKHIITSLIFFLTSLATNFIHIVASSYPQRCALASSIFLILSIAVLIKDFIPGKYELGILCLGCLIFVFSGIQVADGARDVFSVYTQTKDAISIIEHEKEKGNLNIEIPQVMASTKYGVTTELNYENPSKWPNCDIARYFDVDSISILTNSD